MANIYTLTEADIELCKQKTIDNCGWTDMEETANSKNFFEGMPRTHRHFIGLLGEFAWAKIHGYEMNMETWTGKGDDGTDFKGGIQVKSSAITKKPNLLIPCSQWKRKSCKFYYLMWIRLPVAYEIGWISRIEALLVREKIDLKVPTWIIKNIYLHEK